MYPQAPIGFDMTQRVDLAGAAKNYREMINKEENRSAMAPILYQNQDSNWQNDMDSIRDSSKISGAESIVA